MSKHYDHQITKKRYTQEEVDKAIQEVQAEEGWTDEDFTREKAELDAREKALDERIEKLADRYGIPPEILKYGILGKPDQANAGDEVLEQEIERETTVDENEREAPAEEPEEEVKTFTSSEYKEEGKEIPTGVKPTSEAEMDEYRKWRDEQIYQGKEIPVNELLNLPKPPEPISEAEMEEYKKQRDGGEEQRIEDELASLQYATPSERMEKIGNLSMLAYEKWRKSQKQD